MQRTTKNWWSRAGFKIACSGFMCTQYFRDDLTLVLEDAQFINHPQKYEKLIFMHGSRALIGGAYSYIQVLPD